MNRISVVIVTKNEERNVARCVESVLVAGSPGEDMEVLLVDSASTDATVKTALRYPIKVVRMDSSSYLSPSAGRYVGTANSSGEYILFLDGDMTLDTDWLESSLPIIDKDPTVAGIAGKRREFYYDGEHNLIGEKEERFENDMSCSELYYLGGAVLYRRSALEEVGGFNPYLPNNEELELGLQLTNAGYRLLRIPLPMTTHYTTYYTNNTPSLVTTRSILRNISSGRYVGEGRALRSSFRNGLFLRHVRHFRGRTKFVLVQTVGLLCVILAAVTGQLMYLACFAAAFLVLFLLRSIMKKSLLDTVLLTVHANCGIAGMLVGFSLPWRKPERYFPDISIMLGKRE
ncbi:glycosyltransferase [Candidatus Hydrogenedentota bacterium]